MSELDPVRKPTTERVRRPTFLREWRKHRKLTLEVAAQRAGMTPGNLSQMERGTQGYSQAGLEALADVYECDPGQLLSTDPSEEKPKRGDTYISEWREFRGLTQEQLAERADLTQSHLSMLERAERGYTQNTLQAIAGALQVDVGQLLTVHPINNDPKIDFASDRKLQPTFIRHWRKHRGKTLSQVADVIGVSHATISRIETNSQPCSQPILEGIADALDTDAASLLSREPSDYEAIWSIWDRARPFERELIVNVATAILKTRKGD
jgi:transcriptional regulator with XRE-family HTH domain